MKNIVIATVLLVGSQADDPGCAVAVMHNGKQVVNRAYGLADLERNVPLSPDTHFLSPDPFEWKSMEGTTTRFRRAVPYTPTDADLKALAGRYESDELKAVVHMAMGKAGLLGRINETKGEGFEFKAVERDNFQLGMLTIRFLRDKAGKVDGLVFSNPVLSRIPFTRVSESSR